SDVCSSDLVNEAGVVKKKRTDTAKPVAFKNIRPAVLKDAASAGNATPAENKPQPADKPKLIIESSMVEEAETPYGQVSAKPASHAGKPADGGVAIQAPDTVAPTLGALSKIRKQIAQKQTQANHTAKPLTAENLREAWGGYIDKLVEQKNHSAVTNFKLAQLRVADSGCFEIVVESNI